MAPNLLSERNAASKRRSGTLNLFIPEAGPATAPYARFRTCRGFIDDLNRILPIRLRIQLEGEIAEGRVQGFVDGVALKFRWEFSGE